MTSRTFATSSRATCTLKTTTPRPKPGGGTLVGIEESWFPKRPRVFSGTEALKYHQGRELALQQIAAELNAKGIIR